MWNCKHVRPNYNNWLQNWNKKFVFILGSATKAKKLPHMSKINKLRGAGVSVDPKETPPAPVDLLDILTA